ncbi:MAG: hypothetical protein IPJ48_17545 [Propionivibrio sp.]|uniref:Uncharacterized protein n=1 Tax=Candidatus Propionivibrio dominans TaxID=2954373 RepID=A0A9D7F9L7_9RHOO|nr:hypothetical protein [Candidatus Propionivibrio dominans]
MSTGVMAEWVQYDYEATFVAYADLSTSERNPQEGKMATMWVMITTLNHELPQARVIIL